LNPVKLTVVLLLERSKAFLLQRKCIKIVTVYERRINKGADREDPNKGGERINDMKKLFYDSIAKLIGFSTVTIMLSLIFGAVAIGMGIGLVEMNWVLFFLFSILTLILGSTSFILLKKVLVNEPSVIVSSEGIEINGYIPKIGFVPWEDIDGCLPYTLNGQPLLGFVLYDEEKYLKKFNGMNRKILEANKGLGYPAINIPLINLKEKKGLLASLEERKVGFYLENEHEKID
jgi:hypothetical protein